MGTRVPPTKATVALPGVKGVSAEVIGEGRTVAITDGVFADDFAGYGVHLYRVGPK